MYNWQHKNWPKFVYDEAVVAALAGEFAIALGRLKGVTDTLSKEETLKNELEQLTAEAQKTSAIEGEVYSREEILSSMQKELGIKKNKKVDAMVEGLSQMVLDVRSRYNRNLSESAILSWHQLLFNGVTKMRTGKYRIGKEPMQVVSGAIGREKIHYEAPPSENVPTEMKDFVTWYNDFEVAPTDHKRLLIKTAIAHLYFETIHPFQDGNGRIGRAIAEHCLFHSLKEILPVSLSQAIEAKKKNYYAELKDAQSSLAINTWLKYFSGIMISSMNNAREFAQFLSIKQKFLAHYAEHLNPRQHKVINKMFEFGAAGMEGGLSAKKYMSMVKTTKATATRDLSDLHTMGVLQMEGKGRSVRYQLNLKAI